MAFESEWPAVTRPRLEMSAVMMEKVNLMMSGQKRKIGIAPVTPNCFVHWGAKVYVYIYASSVTTYSYGSPAGIVGL